ncbi:acyltransferase [Williamsia deligens]|uniref:acyltransferase n=1 Tax=Williamsia deligens TaxID=321325 RepID=UPI0020A3EB78|nr:acyltransferase [Williamsia deligens]
MHVARGEIDLWLRDIVLNSVLASRWIPRMVRPALLRLVGHKGVHPRALISGGCFIGAWSGLTAERGVLINHGCFFDLGAPVVLRKNVALAYEVMVITYTHDIGPATLRSGEHRTAPVTIGEGSWVGSRSVIMPGVSIGSGCVIGAGSVVTSDCVDNGVYAGAPARLRRILEADGRPRSTVPVD